MSKIKRFMSRFAQRERDKETLLDEFSHFWYIIGIVIGLWILGAVGLIFDGAVLFGMFFNAINSLYISLSLAFLIALIIQVVLGKSVTKTVKVLKRKDMIKKKEFQRMIFVTSFFILIFLSSTLFLSYHTGELIEVASEPTLKQKIKPESDVFSYYDNLIEDEKKVYQDQKNVLLTQVSRLQNDKVFDEPTGKKITRHSNLRTINNLLSRDLPNLERRFSSRVDSLTTQKNNDILLVRNGNKVKQSRHESKVFFLSNATRFGNIVLNLIRCVILAGLMIFVVDAMPSRQPTTVPTGPPDLVPVSNTNTLDRTQKTLLSTEIPTVSTTELESLSDKGDNSSTITIYNTEIIDLSEYLSRLIDRTQKQFTRSFTSSTKEARDRNREKAQEGIKILKDHGYNCEQIDKSFKLQIIKNK